MSGTGERDTQQPHWLDEPRNIALAVLAQGAVAFGIGLAIWYGSGRPLSAFLGWSVADLIVAALTAAVLIGSMQAIALAFPRFVSWAAERQRLLFAHRRRYRPTHILLIAIGAGFGEEALFRGGLQTFAADHLPFWAAILLVSLLFAALHLGSLGIFAFIFAYSLLFGLVYHHSGSLVGVMLAHTIFDVWALALVQRELIRQGFVRPDP